MTSEPSTSDFEDDDEHLIEIINEWSGQPPSQFFKREPSKDSTLIRTQNHALFCIIDQMRNPLSHEAENVSKWIIYKQAAPQKHQKYFGFFRTLYKHVREFNDMGLIKRLNTVYKKATDSGNSGQLYPFEESAIRYIGCAYLRRIYLLKKIREDCLKTSRYAIGMIEIDQWTNLAMVIVAVCGDVYANVGKQMEAIEKTYKHAMRIFRNADERFPEDIGSLNIVQKLKKNEGCLESNSANFASLTKILKFTSDRMTEAQTENNIEKIKSEVLEMILKAPDDVVSTPSRSVKREEVGGMEMGIAIDRTEMNLNASTVMDSSINNESLLSPFLFGKPKKELKKSGKKKAIKRTIEDKESEPVLSNFLTSTLSLLESNKKDEKVEMNSSKKKKKRKN